MSSLQCINLTAQLHVLQMQPEEKTALVGMEIISLAHSEQGPVTYYLCVLEQVSPYLVLNNICRVGAGNTKNCPIKSKSGLNRTVVQSLQYSAWNTVNIQ